MKKTKDALGYRGEEARGRDNLAAKSLIEVDAAKAKMNVVLQDLVELQKVALAPG